MNWLIKQCISFKSKDTLTKFNYIGITIVVIYLLLCGIVFFAQNSTAATIPLTLSKPVTTTIKSTNEEEYIPVNAIKYMPLVLSTIKDTWVDLPEYSYIPALIEQESCYTLTSTNCFTPKSEMKTSREEGGGFLQITRAYNSNGTIRFDSLTDDLHLDPRLKTLNWNNLYSSPEQQLILGIRMIQSSYDKIHLSVPNTDAALDMTDSAYNAGLGGLLNKKLKCSTTLHCDPDQWFNNVELICLTGNQALYGKNTACMINTTHVRNVRRIKRHKYDVYIQQINSKK